MNPHVSESIKKKWMNYEFIGIPFKMSDGKTYMRAHSKAFNATHFYCFEDDWFWHERPVIKTTVTPIDKPNSYGIMGNR